MKPWRKLNIIPQLELLRELFIAEISQFEKTVEKLERIQEQKIERDNRVTELLFKSTRKR
ncbi:DUF6730 family protein [Salegentibacter sp. F14]